MKTKKKNVEIKIIVLSEPNRHGHMYEIEYPDRILGIQAENSVSCSNVEDIVSTVRKAVRLNKDGFRRNLK